MDVRYGNKIEVHDNDDVNMVKIEHIEEKTKQR
jgi:hypothetical protein